MGKKKTKGAASKTKKVLKALGKAGGSKHSVKQVRN